MQNTLCTCGHRRHDHAANPDTREIGGGECLFPTGPEQRMEDGTLLQDLLLREGKEEISAKM
jgi:hypothetical protein